MVRKKSLVALILLLASGLAGVILERPLSVPVTGILDQLAKAGETLAGPGKEPVMLVFLLAKNALVVLLVLMAGPLVGFATEKQAAVATRLGLKWFSGALLRVKGIGGIVVPVVVLVVNGAVTSFMAALLYRMGIPAAA